MLLVLIAEDNALLAFMIEDALTAAGHQILGPASSVNIALELAARDVPDFALVDIDLEGSRSGAELARELKERWGAPCIFATGQLKKARESSRWALGVLIKPFSPDDVVRAVEACSSPGDVGARAPQALELF